MEHIDTVLFGNQVPHGLWKPERMFHRKGVLLYGNTVLILYDKSENPSNKPAASWKWKPSIKN